MARPMTHDLLRNLIGELGATVERIEISDLRDNTYYAVIHLRVGDTARTIDSRPSDAISLALRTKSPIYVARKVLEASSVLQQGEAQRRQQPLQRLAGQVGGDSREDVARRLQVQDVVIPAAAAASDRFNTFTLHGGSDRGREGSPSPQGHQAA